MNNLDKKSEPNEEEKFDDFEISDKQSEKKSEKVDEPENINNNQENRKEEDNNNLININYENINPNENVNNPEEDLNKIRTDNNENINNENKDQERNDIGKDNIIEVNQEINNYEFNDFNLLKNSNVNNLNNLENNLERGNKNEEEMNNEIPKENLEEKKDEIISEKEKENAAENIEVKKDEEKNEANPEEHKKEDEAEAKQEDIIEKEEEKKEEERKPENIMENEEEKKSENIIPNEEKKEENEIKDNENLENKEEEKKENNDSKRNLENNEVINDNNEILNEGERKIDEEKKEEDNNNDKKSNEIKPEEENPQRENIVQEPKPEENENQEKQEEERKVEENRQIENEIQEIKPEENQKEKEEEKKDDYDPENISDIQEERKQDNENPINNIENQEEKKDESERKIGTENNEDKKEENENERIINNEFEPPKENVEEKKEENNVERVNEIKVDENRKENQEEPNKESVVNDDLDVISDKQPEIQPEIKKENSEKDLDENDKEEEKPEKEEIDKEKGQFVEENDNKNIQNDNDNNQPNNFEKLNESEIISEKNENPATNLDDKNIEEVPKEEPKEEKKDELKEKEEDKIETNIYKVDFYRDNLFNLLNNISQDFPLSSVPDFLKRAFNINESIFFEDFYFKGIFPKVIVSKNEKDENKITGMCSFYYQSDEDLNKKLTLRINSIYACQDYEEQIIEMINFIKNNVECDKIMIYILYDKVEDKFLPNKEAKELFEKKLKFKWFCVVRDEELNQRYIQYCFNKKEDIYDVNDENQTTTNVNAIKHNKNNFLMDNLLITSINKEENANSIKEMLKDKINYNKYINIYSLYFLILQAKYIKSDFNDQSMKDELQLMNDKIMKYSIYENTLEKSIKNIDDEIDKSIFKEIKEYLEKNNLEYSVNLFKTNLFINFENNYSTIFNGVYYNRICSDKIQILQEEKTGSKFFLVPSKDNNILFYICEVNNRLKRLLIDGTENVYEKFLEFQPSTQQKLFEFSLKSIRDVSYIPVTPRSKYKTICIPCFSFKTHLFAYDYKGINKNVKLSEIEGENPLNITSVDEFINIEFKPDNNIKNSFTTVEANDLVIENPFIMGIFDNDIINDKKLPLLQFLYVTKDKFLTESNYKLEVV